jgi:hypothetical protein
MYKLFFILLGLVPNAMKLLSYDSAPDALDESILALSSGVITIGWRLLDHWHLVE